MEIKAKYEYDGITHVEFEFNGKKAIVLLPASDKKNGKAILKTEYFGFVYDNNINLYASY